MWSVCLCAPCVSCVSRLPPVSFYRVTPNNINMGPGGEGWGPAFLFVSLYKNLPPDPVTADATYGRLPRSRADRRRAQASVRQHLWVTHTHQAGRRRWRSAARGD